MGSPYRSTGGWSKTADPNPDQHTRGTVLLALGANLLIAAAKLAGGFITGSAALLSEAAHSVADSLNEVFLLAALRRSRREPDAHHPFGYGKERFFWSMLAALGIFVTGSCFSFYQAMRTFGGQAEPLTDPQIAFAVLAIAVCAEGTSLFRAVHQIGQEAAAADEGFFGYLRHGADLTLRTVVAEDSTAVVGVLVAAAGIGGHELTGWAGWEGMGSLAISLLLGVTAFRLGAQAQNLLIGEAADPRLRTAAVDFLSQQAEIDVVLDVLTMQLGPGSVLLAARVDLADGLDSDRVEEVSGRIKAALTARFPSFDNVFLDITDATEENIAEARQRWDRLKAETESLTDKNRSRTFAGSRKAEASPDRPSRESL